MLLKNSKNQIKPMHFFFDFSYNIKSKKMSLNDEILDFEWQSPVINPLLKNLILDFFYFLGKFRSKLIK